jgi:hypothetical protein
MESVNFPTPDPAAASSSSGPTGGAATRDSDPRVLRSFKIPPLMLLTTVLALAAGELANGTGPYFIAMMAITLLCIGVTYNMLGGLSRISGFLFAAMAAATIVISQFAKVVLVEPADKNLEAPHVTITVYAVYYLSAMLGVFLFCKVRLQLPKPLEPATSSQSRVLYWIALVVGIFANTVFWIDTWGNEETVTSTSHSITLALAPMVLFAVVLAVDERILETDGRHSISAKVIISALAVGFFQYALTSRQGLATPIVVYVIACYVRGYRFRFRHYVGLLLAVVLFFAVVSPFEVYSRGVLVEASSFRERLSKGYDLLVSPPSWQEVWNAQTNAETSEHYDQYYSHPGTYVLSRFSMIRADSDLIEVCANGYHYGFEALKTDLLMNIPRVFYRNKPNADSGGFIESLVGTGNKWAFTSIADSFGAFGWAGVVLFPLLVLPLIFIVYDSMFDMSRPWGTVALGIGIIGIWDTRIIDFLVLLIKDPITLWFLSFVTVWVARVLAASGRSRTIVGGRSLVDYSSAELL